MKLTQGALFLQTGSAKAKGTSSSAPAAAATGAAYTVPSGISSGCSKFMKALDQDDQLGSCTAPLLKATSSFSNGNQNKNSLVSVLNTLCSANPCSDKYIRTQLTSFGTACQAELDPSSGNESVRDAYDILYVMQPFLGAICSKDDDGTYCAVSSSSQAANATSSSGGSKKRADQDVYAPDTAAYRNSGIMYLGTLPSLSADSLCTTCTQNVLSSYAKWEATVPYAMGLSNSPMLGDQGDLWTQTKKKCGDSFMNVVTSSVGTANAEANAGVSATQVGVSSAVAGVFAVAMGFWVAL